MHGFRRSLSIGSPLLSTIRRGASRSSCEDLPQTMTPAAIVALRELSPRLYPVLSPRLFLSDVTVRLFICPETSGGMVARTTYLIWTGKAPLQKLTEFLRHPDCRCFQLLVGFPMKKAGGLAQDFTVWTSPATFPRDQKQLPDKSLIGFLRDRFPELNVGE